MNLDQMTSLVRLLNVIPSLSKGRGEIERWATELLRSILDKSVTPIWGAVIVPQHGDGSGQPTSIKQLCGVQDTSELEEKLLNAVDNYWDKGKRETIFIKLSNKKDEPAAYRGILTPIAGPFDKPIGCFWCLTEEHSTEQTRANIEFVAIVTANAIWAAKNATVIEEFSRDTWRLPDLQSLTQNAADLCKRALPCKASIVWLADYKKKSLITTASSGNAGKDIQVDMAFDHGVAGQCFKTRQPVCVDDLGSEPGVVHPLIVAGRGWKSCIMVPFEDGTQVAGIIAAYGQRVRAFSTTELQIVQAIAQRLSAGYIFAKHFDELSELQRKVWTEAPAIQQGLRAIELAHDVRNQLQFANSSLSAVTGRHKHTPGDSDYKDAMAASSFLKEATTQITRLTKNITLDEMEMCSRDLGAILEATVQSVRLRATQANIKVVLTKPVVPVTVMLDEDEISRVVENLMHNAIFFLKSVSRANLLISVTLTTDATSAIVTVRDNGPGIPPYEVERIFDLFFTTKGKKKGLGLGLAIGKRIVEAHGGKLTVTSVWGDYAEFTMRLPLPKGKT